MTQEKYLQVIFEEINELRRTHGIPLTLSYETSIENGKVVGMINLTASYLEIEYYRRFDWDNFLEVALEILGFIEKLKNKLNDEQYLDAAF